MVKFFNITRFSYSRYLWSCRSALVLRHFKIKLKFIRREVYNKKMSVKTFKWIYDHRQYICKPKCYLLVINFTFQEFRYCLKTKTSRFLLIQEIQEFKKVTWKLTYVGFFILRPKFLRKNLRLLLDAIFKNLSGWVSDFYHNNLI